MACYTNCFNYFATLAVLLLALSSIASSQNPELQAQVKQLMGGAEAIVTDESGLNLPPYPDAIKWLNEFWKTGLPRQPRQLSFPDGGAPAPDNAGLFKRGGLGTLAGKQRWVCGQPVNGPVRKTNLVVVPAGDEWTAEKWLDRPEYATFDIIAIHHGNSDTFSCPKCLQVIRNRGPKWRLFLDFTNDPSYEEYAAKYDYIMLPDDDLDMDTCAMNKVFSIMEQFDLILAQPSVCQAGESATWRPELHQRPEYLLRYTTFVEVMAPTYRMDFFHSVARRTFSKYWTYVGWGLDSVWPAFLHYPKDRIAVVDAVCMSHKPTEGGLGNSGKEHSVYAPGLSPYTAKQEELIVFSAFNYSESTTAALGEEFMTLRVIGGVMNWKVLKAMAETEGEPWPSEKVAKMYNLTVDDMIKQAQAAAEFEKPFNSETDAVWVYPQTVQKSVVSVRVVSLVLVACIGLYLTQRWGPQPRAWRRHRSVNGSSHDMLRGK